MIEEQGRTPLFEWAAAGSALDGHASGDLHAIVPGNGFDLIGVIDGLGHGPEAQRAAQTCAALLREHAGKPVLDLVRDCHEGLRGTRGVALTLADVDMKLESLEWVAVGNVEGLLLRPGARGAAPAAIQRGGVVGYRLPPLKSSRVRLERGDLLVFATDGVRSGFAPHVDPTPSVAEIAATIAQRFGKGSDDMLVLVMRYAPGVT